MSRLTVQQLVGAFFSKIKPLYSCKESSVCRLSHQKTGKKADPSTVRDDTNQMSYLVESSTTSLSTQPVLTAVLSRVMHLLAKPLDSALC